MRRVAIVTGGARGIGASVAGALAERGATVVVADIDGSGAEKVAGEIGGVGAQLDVTDGGAVLKLYREVAEKHGRLDLVFNNAGVAIAGLTEELTLDHWAKAIDVNLRGVIHGVHAAYPIMVEQGYGHIVNTASLAGLTPAPLMLPYTTTKHAVVGLSLGLRAEAAGCGVKVSVVCPGFTDTKLIDEANPGLPKNEVSRHAREEAIRAVRRLYTVEALTRDIIRGIARNQAIIVAPVSGRALWRGTRMSPSAAVRVTALHVSRVRRRLNRGAK